MAHYNNVNKSNALKYGDLKHSSPGVAHICVGK